MVAQINCADLPQNTAYPQTGMLQFWLDPYDDLGLGVDLKNPVSQVNTRVIYYPNLEETNPCAHTLVMPDQEKQPRWNLWPGQYTWIRDGKSDSALKKPQKE